MKKIVAFLAVCSFCAAVSAQKDAPVNFQVKMTGNDYTRVTFLGGKNVAGTPYFSDDWMPGFILLKNGSLYRNYQLKYDEYNQVVEFLRDEVSLSVTDPIKQFMITGKDGKLHQFINADEFARPGKPQFYEVLLDDKKGQLLKAYHMIIAESVRDLNIKEKKYLKPTADYLYYEVGSGQLKLLNISPSALEKELELTPQQESILLFSEYHFYDENELVKFFRAYLKL